MLIVFGGPKAIILETIVELTYAYSMAINNALYCLVTQGPFGIYLYENCF